MRTETLVLLAAVGVGAYLLMPSIMGAMQRASQPATQEPTSSTTAQEISAWSELVTSVGSLWGTTDV